MLRLVAEFEHVLLDKGTNTPAPDTIDVFDRVRLVVDDMPIGRRTLDVSRTSDDLRVDVHRFHFDRVVGDSPLGGARFVVEIPAASDAARPDGS